MRKTIALCCLTALAVAGVVPAFGAAKHLLTGKDIKNSSLTGKDIRNSSLTGSDIKNGKLGGADLRRGSIPLNRLDKKTRDLINRLGGPSLPASQAEAGAPGAPGAQGATGPQGPKGDGQINVLTAGNGITATNPSVKFTTAGVVFGPYSDSGSQGGSVKVTNLPTGTTLADIADLTYTASYHHSGGSDNGDAPYLRVFLDNDGDGAVDDDVVFGPSTQKGACAGSGGGSSSTQCNSSDRLIKYDVTKGGVRYDDDPGSTPNLSWDELVNAHKTDKVLAIVVTTGFSLAGTQGALLNSLTYEVAGRAPTTLAFAG
jgi:hypothetical protein